MPIYEYQCESCGHQMEALQKISDDALLTCPSCHEDALKKLVSAAAFKLKGSGWYETDFKKRKDGKAAAGDKGGNTDSKSNKADNGGASSTADKPAGDKPAKPSE